MSKLFPSMRRRRQMTFFAQCQMCVQLIIPSRTTNPTVNEKVSGNGLMPTQCKFIPSTGPLGINTNWIWIKFIQQAVFGTPYLPGCKEVTAHGIEDVTRWADRVCRRYSTTQVSLSCLKEPRPHFKNYEAPCWYISIIRNDRLCIKQDMPFYFTKRIHINLDITFWLRILNKRSRINDDQEYISTLERIDDSKLNYCVLELLFLISINFNPRVGK